MHKFQYDHDTLTSIRLRVQSDMRYKRLDPKLVCQIQNPRLNRIGTRGGKKLQTYDRSINTSNLISPKTNVAITQDYDHDQQSLHNQLLCRAVWLLGLFSLIGNMSRGKLLHVCMMYCDTQLLIFRFSFLCNT